MTFLAEVAGRYVALGRGYSATLAKESDVARTVGELDREGSGAGHPLRGAAGSGGRLRHRASGAAAAQLASSAAHGCARKPEGLRGAADHDAGHLASPGYSRSSPRDQLRTCGMSSRCSTMYL